jgi:hypothetical protein
MNKPTLKEKLISKIQNIDDENILKEIYHLLEIESENLESYTLTDEQISSVNEAKEQISKGYFLTHEEAQIKINQWLNK